MRQNRATLLHLLTSTFIIGQDELFERRPQRLSRRQVKCGLESSVVAIDNSSLTKDRSRCYGESASPQLRAQLKQEFDQILETSFYSHTELIVQLHCRNRDDRARIACKWSRKSGSSSGLKYSSLPLSDLQFNRLDSILQICIRKAGSSRLELWANLVFPTIERE